MIDLNDASLLDIAIDGADEIDTNLQLIKGGGGALLQEKMVAAAAQKNWSSLPMQVKQVSHLGKFPLPVEVIPYGWKQTARHISRLGCNKTVLRVKDNQPLITDHGHYILDCHFEKIRKCGGAYPGTERLFPV